MSNQSRSFNSALLVGVDVGQADQIEAGRDLDREPGKRHAARLLRLLHQSPGTLAMPPAGKSAGIT
jgi:hypothetical protein